MGVPSKILQDDRKTLQKTLFLQKADNDQATAALIQKKEEFKQKMDVLTLRTEEFTRKEQANRARALHFGTFIQCCEEKRRRSLKKFRMERELTQIKMQEIQKLKEELKQLKVRLEEVRKKVAKYKALEDFLQKITHMLPANILEQGADSVVITLMKRHQTLLTVNQNLLENLSSLQKNLEKRQHESGTLQEEHNIAKIVQISKISQLQAKFNALQEKNEVLEHNICCEVSFLRNQKQEISKMLLAISGMAEQCYLSDFGPLETMPLLTKLDMIQEYILEKKEIKQETVPSDLPDMISFVRFKEQAFKKSKKEC
ncbi:hypothetical protein lerEdw1_013005 [Lerista edwardsae]|nr:hypothetical protein lerEdw1_013005 [Lerista edwardsae]